VLKYGVVKNLITFVTRKLSTT